MHRRVRALTGEDVERLPGSCATCLFWELGTASPEPRTRAEPAGAVRNDTPPSDPGVRKQAWVTARVQEGVPPGRIVTLDEDVVAFALFAPAETFAPRSRLVPAVSPDALLLATVWVKPVHRESGVGRLLIQAAVKEALRIDAPAVEVYGDRRFRERGCSLPTSWLLHEGFDVHVEHPRTPLLRLDVGRTVRWAQSLEHAWEEVLGRLPHPAPAPAPRGVSTSQRTDQHASTALYS